MTWARLDDQFHSHPKVARLGPYMLACVGLHALALSWCSAHLTDGVVPKDQVPRLAGDLHLLLPEGSPWGLVERLVAVRMWEDRGDGSYLIHDFLDYNPSGREVLNERKKTKNRVDRWRQRNATCNAVTNATCNAVVTPSPSPSPTPGKEKRQKPSKGTIVPGDTAAPVAQVDHPIREFLGYYQECFRQRFGAAPNVQGGKDAKLVQALLRRYGPETLARYLRAFLDSDDEFIQRSGYTLGVFSACLNKVIVQGTNGHPPRLMPRTQGNVSALQRFVANLQGGPA